MIDLIERQAAIDALNEHRALFCDNSPETFRCLPHDEKCRVDEIDTAVATIVNLPSAQQWIPVSSGNLPEMNKPVLVTHNGKYQAFVSVDWIDPYTTEWNRTCNVTAWCPLPEPYREGGAEDGN